MTGDGREPGGGFGPNNQRHEFAGQQEWLRWKIIFVLVLGGQTDSRTRDEEENEEERKQFITVGENSKRLNPLCPFRSFASLRQFEVLRICRLGPRRATPWPKRARDLLEIGAASILAADCSPRDESVRSGGHG